MRALFFPTRPRPRLRSLVPVACFWVLGLLAMGACGGAGEGSGGVPLVFDVPSSQGGAVASSSSGSLEVQDPALAHDVSTVPAGTRQWDQLSGYDRQLQGEVEAALEVRAVNDIDDDISILQHLDGCLFGWRNGI